MAKKFYAQKDALGFPIPSTMMAADKVPATSVEIPASAPVSYKQHPDKLRYFVRRDRNNKIIPNSLIVSYKQPSGNVLEFRLPA